MKIGKIEIDSPFIFPAIAGYSDMPMRVLCYRYGAGICFTEMVSAKGLILGGNNSESLIVTSASEKIKAVQLFGADPHYIEKAVSDHRLKKFDIIDINMGCPVPKIVKSGEGSAIMKNPTLAYDIVRAACSASEGRPVTVKMRAGFDCQNMNAPKIAELCEKAGASAVTVHGRVREQYYRGGVDLEIIKQVKESLGIPVIGNGNICDTEGANLMFEKTGCDAIAVARAAIGRPYIFEELRGFKPEYDICKLVEEHFSGLRSYLPERVAVNNLKKHFLAYVKGLKGSKEMKNRITSSCCAKDILSIIEDLQNGS